MASSASRLAATALLALALAALAVAGAQSGDGSIEVTGAWARPTLGQSRTVAAYLTILNRGAEADRLLAIETDVANAAEIHESKLDGEVMTMRRVESIEIAAGGSVELKPGGMHVMLIDAVRPLKKGDRLTLKLRFERAGALEAPAIVSMKPPAGSRGSHGSGG